MQLYIFNVNKALLYMGEGVEWSSESGRKLETNTSSGGA